jgi:antitoxin VapB
MDTAKVFTTGRSQAVRLPKEFRFKSSEVCIKRIGSVVILFDPNDRLKMLLGAMGEVTRDFMTDRRQPKTAERRRRL